MSDTIRLQVLSIGNNGLEKELFNVQGHLSVVFEFRLTRHKRLYFKKKNKKKKGLIAYFTSTIKTIYKEEIITENTTVCRNLDTCTRVLALLDKIKSLERGGASVK